PPALVARTEDGYALAFKIEMALCLVLTLLLARRLAASAGVAEAARARLPGAFAAAVLALGVVCTHRFDASLALSMTAALLAAGFGGGVGGALTGAPPLRAPPVAVAFLPPASSGSTSGRVRWQRALAAAGASVAAAGGLLAAAWAWGGRGVLDAFAYHQAR